MQEITNFLEGIHTVLQLRQKQGKVMGHVRINGKRSYDMTLSAAACLIEFPETPHIPDKCTFLRSVHLLFPFAKGGNIGLVRQIFQTHD